jgi:acyl-coenzyme A synthetase/AMP-(fatty) acid ligase
VWINLCKFRSNFRIFNIHWHPCSSGSSLAFPSLSHLVSLATSSLASHHGLKPGDVVLPILFTSMYSLAALSLGSVLSPANSLLSRSEFESQISNCSWSFILTRKALSSKLRNLMLKPLLFIEDFVSDLLTTPKSAMKPSANVPTEQIQSSHPTLLMYSSSTTGKSKGVVCTHANMITMACP